MEEKSGKWTLMLVGALITAALTIVAGVAVYYLTERAPDLRYTVVEAPPFLGEKKNMAIYRIDVSNRGKKEVEDVAITVGFPGANIEDSKIETPPTLPINNQTSQQLSSITTKVLNPEEKIGLSYLVSFTSSNRVSPDVSVRAKGVLGKPVDSTSSRDDNPFKYSALLLGVFVGSLSLIITRKAFAKKLLPLREHIKDSQAQIISYLCFLHGLQEEGDKILDRAQKNYYWSASDQLTLAALNSKDNVKSQRTIDCLQDIITYSSDIISKSSKAVIMANIAKIYLHLENEAEAVEWVNKACKLHPDILKLRLQVDNSLREFTLRNNGLMEARKLIEQG